MKRIVTLCCAMLMCVLLAGFAAAATDTVATSKDLSYKDGGLTLMPALYTAHQTKIGLTAQLYTAALATASNEALASLAPPKAPNLDTKQLYGMVGKQPPNLTALGGEFTGAAPNTIYVLMNNPGKRLTNLLSAQPPDQKLIFNTSLDQPLNLPAMGERYSAAAPNSDNLLANLNYGPMKTVGTAALTNKEGPFQGFSAGFGLVG